MNDLPPQVSAAPWRFSLRMLFVGILVIALELCVLQLAGKQVIISASIVGIAVGGATSILGRNKRGRTPLIIVAASLVGSLTSQIIGVFQTGFDVRDWDNPLGKAPLGLDDLFWFSLYGSILCASLAAFSCWCVHRSSESLEEH